MRRRPERVLGDQLLPHMKEWRTATHLATVTGTKWARAWDALSYLSVNGKAEFRQVKHRSRGRTVLGAAMWRRKAS